MAIRDVSGLPDSAVPTWVREARERRRADDLKLCSCMRHFGTRGELLTHTDATKHRPLVAHADDPYLTRH